ncbi:MAG: 30S ribosomal protein S19 [Candidatus Gracilibacteria bacterium]|jgi:small subunit ribosomal protein S19
MSRSLKKSPFIPDFLLKRVAALNVSGRKSVIKLWKRASVIHPDFVGHTFGVHNGKDHIPVFVTEDMVGHRLGEFSPTRKFMKHAGKK